MVNENLGTKRVCPETSRKFYDLGKNPIISPYSGKQYPLAFFEDPEPVPVVVPQKAPEEVKVAEKAAASTNQQADADADEDEEGAGPEFISLEDADAEESGGEEIPEIDDSDIEIDDNNDTSAESTFLEEEDDSATPLADVIVPTKGEEES